jgi:hypothetical protein
MLGKAGTKTADSCACCDMLALVLTATALFETSGVSIRCGTLAAIFNPCFFLLQALVTLR